MNHDLIIHPYVGWAAGSIAGPESLTHPGDRRKPRSWVYAELDTSLRAQPLAAAARPWMRNNARHERNQPSTINHQRPQAPNHG